MVARACVSEPELSRRSWKTLPADPLECCFTPGDQRTATARLSFGDACPPDADELLYELESYDSLSELYESV